MQGYWEERTRHVGPLRTFSINPDIKLEKDVNATKAKKKSRAGVGLSQYQLSLLQNIIIAFFKQMAT